MLLPNSKLSFNKKDKKKNNVDAMRVAPTQSDEPDKIFSIKQIMTY